MTKFIFTKNYEITLARIEEHIFLTTGSIKSVESFLDEHDQVLKFIADNPQSPAVHPVTGDQSWNFGSGRYRLFFRCVQAVNDLIIYLTHLIDNKEINLDIYPSNRIPTYDED